MPARADADATDFNPRSPRGERQAEVSCLRSQKGFQSTLPARGATTVAVDRRFGKEFQSTLPARGATWDDAKAANAYRISIHAPREGSDLRLSRAKPKARNFNPRSPRGERRHGRDHHGQKSGFQSTLPARGATHQQHGRVGSHSISIHAPREGSDSPRLGQCRESNIFQSTLPARGATKEKSESDYRRKNFNPRSPRGERLCAPIAIDKQE